MPASIENGVKQLHVFRLEAAAADDLPDFHGTLPLFEAEPKSTVFRNRGVLSEFAKSDAAQHHGTINGAVRLVKAGARFVLRSAKFLGESDEKPFGSTDVAEPIRFFILDYFAYELRAARAEPFKRRVDVVHSEHDAEVA